MGMLVPTAGCTRVEGLATHLLVLARGRAVLSAPMPEAMGRARARPLARGPLPAAHGGFPMKAVLALFALRVRLLRNRLRVGSSAGRIGMSLLRACAYLLGFAFLRFGSILIAETGREDRPDRAGVSRWGPPCRDHSSIIVIRPDRDRRSSGSDRRRRPYGRTWSITCT